jgi:hypothetical protein
MVNNYQQRMQKQFTLSKKRPTRSHLAPVVDETNELCFLAVGNTIQVFSLRTQLHIKTIRQANQEKGVSDVHKSEILSLTLAKDKLTSICARGTLAEWDPQS